MGQLGLARIRHITANRLRYDGDSAMKLTAIAQTGGNVWLVARLVLTPRTVSPDVHFSLAFSLTR